MTVWIVIAYLSFSGTWAIIGPKEAYLSPEACGTKVDAILKSKDGVKPEVKSVGCTQLTIAK